MGFTSMVWAFFLFREPRQGAYHQVETLSMSLALMLVVRFSSGVGARAPELFTLELLLQSE